jgi:hypothetical protein
MPMMLDMMILLEHLIASGVQASGILTFGDGRVEIQEAKAAGGTAVGTS